MPIYSMVCQDLEAFHVLYLLDNYARSHVCDFSDDASPDPVKTGKLGSELGFTRFSTSETIVVDESSEEFRDWFKDRRGDVRSSKGGNLWTQTSGWEESWESFKEVRARSLAADEEFWAEWTSGNVYGRAKTYCVKHVSGKLDITVLTFETNWDFGRIASFLSYCDVGARASQTLIEGTFAFDGGHVDHDVGNPDHWNGGNEWLKTDGAHTKASWDVFRASSWD